MPPADSGTCCSRSSRAWAEGRSTALPAPSASARVGVGNLRDVRALVDLLVPSLCDGCGARARPPWCDACEAAAQRQRPADPCPRCAGAAGPGHACWSAAVPIEATTALSTWSGTVARAVLHAKLAGRREVLSALGRRVAALVPTTPEVVVPVPTDRRRARRRGLDHTRVLATAVAAELAVPVVSALRTGLRLPDRGAAATQGHGPLPVGAVRTTAAAHRVTGRAVLVVDDVVTTGETLAAAVAALHAVGAASCAAAVVARAGAHPLGAAAACATRSDVRGDL